MGHLMDCGTPRVALQKETKEHVIGKFRGLRLSLSQLSSLVGFRCCIGERKRRRKVLLHRAHYEPSSLEKRLQRGGGGGIHPSSNTIRCSCHNVQNQEAKKCMVM